MVPSNPEYLDSYLEMLEEERQEQKFIAIFEIILTIAFVLSIAVGFGIAISL